MKKGVVGGLVVAGLAGLAGFAALKMSNNDAAAVGGGADLGGGYYEGSSASGGGVPDLTSFIQRLGGGGVSTVNTDDLILDTMLKTMKPSDENADKLQAAVLADALTDTNLASSNMIYNALLERGDVEENPDGTYNYNGYVYMDRNQLNGELARQAAIQSIGLDAYNALSGGQKSVLISSIRAGKANYVDSSVVSSKDRLSNGNISNETFDTLLSNTLAGVPTSKSSSNGGTSLIKTGTQTIGTSTTSIYSDSSGKEYVYGGASKGLIERKTTTYTVKTPTGESKTVTRDNTVHTRPH